MTRKFGLLLFLASTFCLADGDIVQPRKPIEGTYFFKNRYSTTIIKLERGGFWYWFDSDVRLKGAPGMATYPVTGRYIFKNGVLHLPNESITQQEWHMVIAAGKPVLLRDDALNDWRNSRKLDDYGALQLTKKSPQNILEGH